MVDPILFGGTRTGAAGQPLLDHLPVGKYVTDFNRWLAVVHAHTPEAPTETEPLRVFDPWSMLPRFRDDYESGQLRTDVGLSVQDAALLTQLMARMPVTCLLSDRFADQPTEMLRRKRVLPPRELAAQSRHNLARIHGIRVSAQTWLGSFGHSITLVSGDPGGRWIEYLDNQGSRTLIEGATRAGDGSPEAWRIPTERFAEIVVAVALPQMVADVWTEDQQDTTPVGPPADEPKWRPWLRTEREARFDLMSVDSKRHPGSRARQANATWAFAQLINRNELAEETVRWIRRAALMGSTAAARQLIVTRLAQGDEDESQYWATALSGETLFVDESADIDDVNLDAAGRLPIQSGSFHATTRAAWDAAIAMTDPAQREDALGLFDQVIAEGHHELAPNAALKAANLVLAAGDTERAVWYFRQATLSTCLPVIVPAAMGFATASRQLGDPAGRVAGLGRAAFSGLPTPMDLRAVWPILKQGSGS